jgi:hypothetical protein
MGEQTVAISFRSGSVKGPRAVSEGRSNMAGYSGTPLAKKLGIKPGSELHVVDGPVDYALLVDPLPEGVKRTDVVLTTTDIVHLFTTGKADLARALESYRKTLKPEAVIWVSWPKKSSKVPTDITEDTVREVALPLGFVDVKVCAVTDVWSGLKLVVRRELR